MAVRVKHLTSSVADLRKVLETSARKFWATWTPGRNMLKNVCFWLLYPWETL